MSLTVDVADALGKVTGSVDMGPEGVAYFVDIEFKSIGITLNVKLKEDQLLTPMEYLNKKILGSFKSSLETFGSRILRTDNPDCNSWMKNLIEKWEKEHPLKFDPTNVKKFAKEAAAHKMPKERCIKLLESYRAERAKAKAGRRFERCLRDSVVDEALERAIELLKAGIVNTEGDAQE